MLRQGGGASTTLYLTEGLLTGQLFRERAAVLKGVRVWPEEQNLITIFNRGDKRVVVNLDEIEALAKTMGAPFGLQVQKVDV